MKQSIMNRIFLGAVCGLMLSILLMSPIHSTAKDSDTEDGWITIFNGKNLDGWVPKFSGYELGENYGNTFRVEDGCLTVSYDQYEDFGGRFGHIFYKHKFSYYKISLEYRFMGEQVKGHPGGWAFRNNGIMLHCQSPESMGLDQDFPVSIEVQLLGGNGKDSRSTGNLCTPGTHVVMDGGLLTRHCTNSNSDTYHGDQWVTAEVVVHGSEKFEHYINGTKVMEYTNPQYDENDKNAKKLMKGDDKLISEGYISLQAESHPCQFRNIKILPLEK